MADQPPQKKKGILAFLKPLSVEQFEEQKRRDAEMARKQADIDISGSEVRESCRLDCLSDLLGVAIVPLIRYSIVCRHSRMHC